MNYTIDTVEEAYDELELKVGFLLEKDEDHQIWLDGPFIRVPASPPTFILDNICNTTKIRKNICLTFRFTFS